MRRSSEQERLEDEQTRALWLKWGPYLSERQWGTVREDYSADGSAWDYFTHDAARSRAYRWGEDGLAGISDDQQQLCFALALWNGRDPILKERLFGLTNQEGNHGEDVKEIYHYLDATPTASWLKMLYRYPQAEFPYARLVEENRRRGGHEPEFDLLDTGVFDDDRYFDVFIEYAKADPEDLLIQITARNRGPADAPLHVLPQVWFRNTWSWRKDQPKPRIRLRPDSGLELSHEALGVRHLHCEGRPAFLFCDNETNASRLFGAPATAGCWKDAFHDHVIHGRKDAVNPGRAGTKAAAHYAVSVPASGSVRIRLRLRAEAAGDAFGRFDEVFRQRQHEADEFYAGLQRDVAGEDACRVQRQAFAGMIWGKQFYHFDVPQWLAGDPAQPPSSPQRQGGRDSEWEHLNNADILSMPDKWEYPWYAAWDLAFQCIPLAMIDPGFAKEQLILLTREWYMHPNGQFPAYEWSFGDANPPVHAWAAWRVYQIDQRKTGKPDRAFLERVFHKLLLNFTWWVNRKDVEGRNIFHGGFLGLDNISIFDRGAPLPGGGHLNQADATSWMAMYCLDLMRIALELSCHNPIYQDLATKFFEHFLYIAAAMTNAGGRGISLWSDDDEFFYDVLSTPALGAVPLKLRSMVGLIPLFAVEVLDADLLRSVPEFARRLEWFLQYRPDLAGLVSRWYEAGRGDTRLLSLLRGHRMKRLLKRMLDPAEFLSPYGVRALSRHYLDNPYSLPLDGVSTTVAYQPGESDSRLFGGNSNWRGPVWMPVNYLIIESLHRFHGYYGDEFKVECPTGSGMLLTLRQIAEELTRRLTRLFLRDEQGRRPIFGQREKLQADPHFRDCLLFHEYFHGDNGRGCGAAHQTGWTGLIAALLAPGAVGSGVHCPPCEATGAG